MGPKDWSIILQKGSYFDIIDFVTMPGENLLQQNYQKRDSVEVKGFFLCS